ncbi:helix-turn-helix domain-containing protein [Rhodobium gokarnense]|uniref:Excisionase family DNA binding protein n=1 Tax=Rhodobium gokarnense TaxID=364296 RepID=A0ABT3HHM2_9HYPH|nr:helix-turn-helix domain-containing protein [Rhodobium gokarnense]MCW2309903.1 excisionase family DNA binding protein [Rhodobium gokarnense]
MAEAARRDQADTLAYSVQEACRACGIGKTTLYAAIKAGHLTPRKLGTKTLILRRDLEGFLERLPQATE